MRRLITAAPAAFAASIAGLGGVAGLGEPASAQTASVKDTIDARAVEAIEVIGQRSNLLEIPGSGQTIEAEDLELARVFTVNEALRQVAGVNVRDEEGLGLRPNIGIRGLNPTRSSEVTLLEDGLPLAFALYGDNASYSHPPLRRFERIEVLKGASQIRFGPHTVGGVVNYLTPAAPDAPEARLTAAGGNEGYLEFDLSAGAPVLGFRALSHVNATRFDGVRANQAFAFNDYYLKLERDLAPSHGLTLRAGAYEEDSQVSYSGLTEAEFAADPRGNPFSNDFFATERFTTSASHAWALSPNAELTTSAYSIWFDRDWWRQSSNSGQRPNDASDPACGGLANVNTTCGNEGRLREFNVYGLESRLNWDGRAFGVDTRFETGLRYQAERQNRLQINGDTPDARTPGTSVNAGIREDNRRYADAWSGFAAATFDLGRFAVSPGVRVEAIDFERANRLTGARAETDLTEVIPGLGATFALNDALVIYGGVHRGFSPPGAADILTDAGGVIELDAEESWNYELGLRGTLTPGLDVDVAAFVLDFENQIVPASVAGGVGSTVTSAGETKHQGLEASLRGSLKDAGLMPENDVFARAAVTWLESAEYEGARFSSVSGFGAVSVSVSGNRLPYAPEWLFTGAVGYARGSWLTTQVEVQYVGEQFADDLNTVLPSENGQRGIIPEQTTWNASLNLTPGDGRIAYYATVKNVFDDTHIVDRSRGIIPNAPRLVQAGVTVRY